MRAATPRPPPLPAGTETFEVTLDGSASLERQIRAALAAARARRRPREPPAPAAPHPRASRASLAAARGSALASIGKDVLARASFPGLTRDVIVVRATSPLERYKCDAARREQVNVLRRAKRTPRVVRTDADALDDLASTAHVYVTYDHPASRQTLAVARVLDPGDDRCASDAVDRRESSDDKNVVDPPEDETALRSLLDAARSWASKTEPAGPVYVVDKFFATGLSTVPDPVAFPKLCRALLLRGCEEIARRGGEGAGMLVAAPNGTLPDEALLLCDGHEDNGGSSAGRVRDDSRRERRVGPSPLLKTTAFRVLAREEEDEAEDKAEDEASASGASASESSRPVSSEFERRPPPSVAEVAAAHADRPRLVARAHRRVAEAVLGALAFENDRGAAFVDDGSPSTPRAVLLADAAAAVAGAYLPSVRRDEPCAGAVGLRLGLPLGASGGPLAELLESLRDLASLVEPSAAPRSFPLETFGDEGVSATARAVAAKTAKDRVLVVACAALVPVEDGGGAEAVPAASPGTSLGGAQNAQNAAAATTSDASAGSGQDDALAVARDALASLEACVGPAGALILFRAFRTDETRPQADGARGGGESFAIEVRRRRVRSNDSSSAAAPPRERRLFVSLHDAILVAASLGLVLAPAGAFARAGPGASGSAAPFGVGALFLRRVGYAIRRGLVPDAAALVAVEAKNWGPGATRMRTPRATIEDRLSNNPECNLVVCSVATGECLGGVYFQRIRRRDDADAYPWKDKERARIDAPPPPRWADSSAREKVGSAPTTRSDSSSESGSFSFWVQLMDIHVCQTFSAELGRAVGDELRAFALDVAMLAPGASGVCAVTRTRGFRATQLSEPRLTYAEYVRRNGGTHDRGLLFHVGNGARVVRPVFDWRPADVENDGCGCLIEYPLEDIRARRWAEAADGVAALARDDDADDDEEKKTRAAREDDARVTSEGSSREEVRESDREHLSEVVVTLAETFPSEATAKSQSPQVPNKAEGLEKSAASVEKDSEESSEVPRRARASSRSPLDGLFDAAGSDGRSDTASEDTDERASEGEGEGESESGEK